ncbi:MAG: MEKHLA domain-containing protein [Verrucomicrobiota bacterium]
MDELGGIVSSPEWVAQSRLILDSYARCVGRELIERARDPRKDAQTLFEVPFVVASHNTAEDPVLNYGNQMALKLWEADLDEFLRMPSRLTAEPVEREERARMLQQTAEKGFIDDYEGVRISLTGKRFLIEQAIVWNLVDASGLPAGQAATFSTWKPL